MGTICKFLAAIYLVICAVGAFIAFYGINSVLGTFQAVIVLIMFVFGAVITAAILYTVGTTQDAVNEIAYSMKNKSYSKFDSEEQKERVVNNGGWKCPDCNRVHYSYESTCQCGRSKFD